MKVGFTGTQEGLTKIQKIMLIEFLVNNVFQIEEVAHGDCIGADAEFHSICYQLGIKIVIHPPLNPKKRAYCTSPYVLEPKEYIERNHNIVDSSTLLLATPKLLREEQRSGTWATIRYALNKIPVNVFYNDGGISYDFSKD